jgi:pentatricopeptide repeat protein
VDLLISDMSFDEKIEKLLAAEDTDEAIKLFQDMVRLGKNIETWSNAG